MRMNRQEWEAVLNEWVADRTLLRVRVDVARMAASMLVRSVAVGPLLRLETDDGCAAMFVRLDDSCIFEYGNGAHLRSGEPRNRSLTISFQTPQQSEAPDRIVLFPAGDRSEWLAVIA